MIRIFISYRRSDSEDLAGHLAERLRQEFGASSVFFDVNSIQSGQLFAEVIEANLARADTILILIGAQWLKVVGANGTRRLDDPEDFVRREVELALKRGASARVVPVLIKNAPMPLLQDLPPSLHDLTKLNAATVRTGRDFDRDVADLIATIRSSKRGRVTTPTMAAVLLAVAIIAIGIFILSRQNGVGEQGESPISANVTKEQSPELVIATEDVIAETITDTFVPTATPAATDTVTSTNTLPSADTSTPVRLTPTITPTIRAVSTNLPTAIRVPTLTPSEENTVEAVGFPPSGTPSAVFPCPANIISSESQVLNIVRSSPSDSSPAVIGVIPNEPVLVLGISRQNTRTYWYQIARNESESLGWIAPRYVVLSPLCPSP